MYWIQRSSRSYGGSGHFNDGGGDGVADALAGTGFTAMVGDAVAVCSVLASHRLYLLSPLLCLQYLRHLHGFEYGVSIYFCPHAIAACTSLGLNPTAAAIAVVFLAGMAAICLLTECQP